ncbi:MAG TPA: hypothetical protein VMD99_03960 [Terriglobales bacterium]|nr:hypothetical protein [Terriglobales bacterium]
MDKTIYMPLIEEGADCWRPVRAVHIGADVFEVTEKIPANEVWAFAPFSRVRCRDRVFADGNVGLAIFAYAIESHPYYRLLKESTGKVVRIMLADGESALVRVGHVDEEHEDFICDLMSTNLEQKYAGIPKDAVYAVKFVDLISVGLEK